MKTIGFNKPLYILPGEAGATALVARPGFFGTRKERLRRWIFRDQALGR